MPASGGLSRRGVRLLAEGVPAVPPTDGAAAGPSVVVGVFPRAHSTHVAVQLGDQVLHGFLPEEGQHHPHYRDVINATVAKLLATFGRGLSWDAVRLVVVAWNSNARPLEFHGQFAPFGPPVVLGASHHEYHAAYAFYASPFRTAVVVAFDGIGMSDLHSFTVWRASRAGGVRLLGHCPACRVGILYGVLQMISRFKRELTVDVDALGALTAEPDARYVGRCVQHVRRMGAAEWGANGGNIHALTVKWLKDNPPTTDTRLRSLQVCVETIALQYLKGFSDALDRADRTVVFTGGVAQNAALVGFLRRSLGLRAWIPPLPGDGTQAIGAIWSVAPPPRRFTVWFQTGRSTDDSASKQRRSQAGRELRQLLNQPNCTRYPV